jgi:diguanylate cyclase (GGDEF)-like protein
LESGRTTPSAFPHCGQEGNIDVDHSAGDQPADAQRNERVTARPTRRSIVAVILPALVASACLGVAFASLATGDVPKGWSALVALAVGSLIAQVARPGRPASATDRTAIAFIAAGAVLLPPQLLLVLVVAHVVASWLGERRPWLERLIDLAAAVLASLAASAAWQLAEGGPPGTGALLAGVLAVASLHAMRLPAYRLLRRESSRPLAELLLVDFVLVSLGAAAATLWGVEPWLATLALGPLLLVQRSLAVPQLVAETRVDPKTGLYNARWFSHALEEELGRAKRFERPLSLIMADLDLLRDINNVHGHLAGDAVLRGVAGIFRAQLRHYDVPARFGGEEFSILLPETSPERALEIAERIRIAVSERAFTVETSPQPIRATISIGIAGFPSHAAEATELVHRADVAVYKAKLAGRNRTVVASPAESGGAGRVMRLPLAADPSAPTPRERRVGKPRVERRGRSRPGPVRARLIDAAFAPASPVGLTAAGGALAGVAALIVGVVAGSPALLAGAAVYAGVVFAGPLVVLRRADRRARSPQNPASDSAEPAPAADLEQVS